jgi:Tfp pilus assembly protein PilX
MNTLRTLVGGERGVALVLALIVLLSLTGLVLAFLSMSAFEPQISQNLTDTINARMIADSGVEFAYSTLVTTTSWSTVLTGATAATCTAGNSGIVLGTADTSLPGLTASSGTFTVRVRNDCQPNDAMMTGITAESSASPATDANNRVVLESTGTKNGASRTINVVVKRATVPTINAALAFPGVQADVNFNGSTFTIDGRDTRLTDTIGTPTGTASPVFAITTADNAQGSANATQVKTALANNQQNDVIGKNPPPPNGTGPSPATVTGDAAVTPDSAMTSQMVTDFLNAVRSMADITIASSSSNPFSINDIGSTCSANINSTSCWGTDAQPKIVYINATLANANEQLTALAIAGNSTGTGILIVENGNVSISGNFQWHGPVIVTGNNVGIQYRGGGNQSVLGGVVVNELHSDGSTNLEGDIRGNAKMAYSKEALDLVTLGLSRRLTSTYSWREK